MREAIEYERERKSLEDAVRGPRGLTVSVVVFGVLLAFALAVDVSHVFRGYHYPMSLVTLTCLLLAVLQIRVWRATRTLAAAISRIEARLVKLEEQAVKQPQNVG